MKVKNIISIIFSSQLPQTSEDIVPEKVVT